jgi:hypothetical protein
MLSVIGAAYRDRLGAAELNSSSGALKLTKERRWIVSGPSVS